MSSPPADLSSTRPYQRVADMSTPTTNAARGRGRGGNMNTNTTAIPNANAGIANNNGASIPTNTTLAPILDRFQLLAQTNNWDPDSDIYWDNRRQFIVDAIRDGFRRHFGTDETDVAAWRSICAVVEVKQDLETLQTVADCKKVCTQCFHDMSQSF